MSLNVNIPIFYFFKSEIDGECGGCRFKSGIRCTLFDKDTDYDANKEMPKRIKECKELTIKEK